MLSTECPLLRYSFSTYLYLYTCTIMYKYTGLVNPNTYVYKIHLLSFLECMSYVCAAAKECVPGINKTPQDVADMVSNKLM